MQPLKLSWSCHDSFKLNPEEFNEIIKDESAFVIDVHTPEQEHIPGTDAIIPFDEVTSRLDELPSKDSKIVLYCRSGSMSAKLFNELKDLGYTNVYDLEGGRNAWLAYENSK